jgi:hypothetical protein
MTNDEDMIIRETARNICASQVEKQDSYSAESYLIGNYDHTVWMRLVEQGIQRGIEIGRML